MLAGVNAATSQSANQNAKGMGINGTYQNTINTNTQFMYDAKEPNYCYCGRGSFGEMVMCENPFCEKEWFHLDCIEEKNLPDRWYCIECQKHKDKTRNNVSRGFFVNKDNDPK